MKIDHIGIAVQNWEAEVERWQTFSGLQPEVEEVPKQGMKMAIFKLDNATIELIGSTSPDSPVSKFLEKRGTGIHHVCFGVDDIIEKIQEANLANIKMIDKQPRIGSNNHKIAFYHPKSFDGVLVEIAEISK